MTFTYKLNLEEHETVDGDTKIELYGFVPEFTLNELKGNIEVNNKQLREVTSNLEYQNKKIENIEKFHKYVLKLTPEKLFTIHMYQESLTNKNKYEEVKVRLEKQIEEDIKEMSDVLTQIPELVTDPSADVVEGKVTLKENERTN